jgi:histone H3/H4
MDSASENKNQPGAELPRDAQVVAALLKSMGVQEWEPRVINQLMEFMYTYASDIVNDSKDYALHAGHQTIEVSDVKLAVEQKSKKYQPPSRQDLVSIAKRKNQIPLPMVSQKVTGVILPPDEYCLLKENYQVAITGQGNDAKLHL